MVPTSTRSAGRHGRAGHQRGGQVAVRHHVVLRHEEPVEADLLCELRRLEDLGPAPADVLRVGRILRSVEKTELHRARPPSHGWRARRCSHGPQPFSTKRLVEGSAAGAGRLAPRVLRPERPGLRPVGHLHSAHIVRVGLAQSRQHRRRRGGPLGRPVGTVTPSPGAPLTSSRPPAASQSAVQPASVRSKRPAGVIRRRGAARPGAGPLTTSTASTRVRGEWAGRTYQTRAGVSLLSASPRVPGARCAGPPAGRSPTGWCGRGRRAGPGRPPRRPRRGRAARTRRRSPPAGPGGRPPGPPRRGSGPAPGAASRPVKPPAIARSGRPSLRAASAAATVSGEVAANTRMPEAAISSASAPATRSAAALTPRSRRRCAPPRPGRPGPGGGTSWAASPRGRAPSRRSRRARSPRPPGRGRAAPRR